MRDFFSSCCRFVAWLLMLAVMSTSVAMAAYVCPQSSLAAAPQAVVAVAMENCVDMDMEKPALCATQLSSAQLALEHVAVPPALAPITVSTIAPAFRPRASSLPLTVATVAPSESGADPPYLRTRRLRI